MTKKSSTTAETKNEPVAGGHSRAPVNAPLTKEAKIELYRQMVRIRRFEERSLRAYQAKKIGGFLHLYIGQEAVAVGCCSLLGQNDHIITAYRDHGHALAVGMDMKPLMAELYGKATGCSKGKGGSMHFFDPSRNFWGGHGIVGGQIPLGTGIAYALKYQGLKGACLAFMGDGAVNQGAVHEAYNLAALWQLPVIFVIENNGYSMGTSQARSSAGDLARRAEAYGMAWGMCDGHDLYEVRAGIVRYPRSARARSPSPASWRCGPTATGAIRWPTRTTPTAPRSRSRSTARPRTRSRSSRACSWPRACWMKAASPKIDAAARAEAEQAAEFAEASPYPAVEDIQKDVYWEEDNPAEKKSQGRIFFD